MRSRVRATCVCLCVGLLEDQRIGSEVAERAQISDGLVHLRVVQQRLALDDHPNQHVTRLGSARALEDHEELEISRRLQCAKLHLSKLGSRARRNLLQSLSD